MTRFNHTIGLASLILVMSCAGSFAQDSSKWPEKTNTSCIWSMTEIVQVFETICHPEERGEYRAALDEATTRLRTRARELLKEDFDNAVKVMRTISGDIAKNPEQCRGGVVFDMAQTARKKGASYLREMSTWAVSVPAEKQLNECL